MDIFTTARLIAARDFATQRHEGQVRKYTGEPYITHPLAVAAIIADYVDDEDLIIGALFHDLVEDTDTTLAEIHEHFGARVADMVDGLTNVSREEDGPSAARKALDMDHIAKGDADVHTIKAADILHNTPSILEYDPSFAKVYIPEKHRVLDVIRKAQPMLLMRAYGVIFDGAAQLGIRL